MHINKIALLFIAFASLISCKPKPQPVPYNSTWIEVKKAGNTFQLVDCGYPGERITVANDSVYHHGVMENYNFKADHTRQENGQITFYPEKNEHSFYKFSWLDEDEGIAQWQISSNGASVVKYYVNQNNLKNIKMVKGTKSDCVTSEEAGDRVNDSLAIGDGSKTLFVEDDNCISIRNNKGQQEYERCFEGVTLQIRHVQGNTLPLTLISGKRLIEINFDAAGTNWISKQVAYYSGDAGDQKKATHNLAVSIKDFEFDAVASSFDQQNESVSAKLDDLQNEEKLQDIEVYGVADILSASPVNKTNLAIYAKAAQNLIKIEKYNEARIILLDVVKAAPNTPRNYLDLGDAQWGFEDRANAKQSYQQYINVLQKQGSSTEQIPQRVNDRVK